MDTLKPSVFDCPIYYLRKTGRSSITYPEKNGVIIFPDEHAIAAALLPRSLRVALRTHGEVYVHIPSTCARLGMDALRNEFELPRHIFPFALPIVILNRGWIPVLIRNGDTVAIADHTLLKAHPVPISHIYPHAHPEDEQITLHIENSYLDIIRRRLLIHAETGVRYIDPRIPNLRSLTDLSQFESLEAEPGDHYVFPVWERFPRIPEGMILVFSDEGTEEIWGMQHSTATLAYPHDDGDEGRQFAVEIIVREKTTIKPGRAAATARLYKAFAQRRGPERYVRQRTIHPHNGFH